MTGFLGIGAPAQCGDKNMNSFLVRKWFVSTAAIDYAIEVRPTDRLQGAPSKESCSQRAKPSKVVLLSIVIFLA